MAGGRMAKQRWLGLRTVALAVALVLSLPLAARAATVEPAERAAIIIGNGDYSIAPLANPLRDAGLIGNALTDFGFSIYSAGNLSSDSFDKFLDSVLEKVAGTDLLVVYYAGHAIQYKGDNRLLMTDIAEAKPKAILDGSKSVSELITKLSGAVSGTLVILLDACRDNPLVSAGSDFTTGLSYVETGSGEIVIGYATSAGQTAADGYGGNSPYAVAIANAMQTSDITLLDALREVRRAVREATNGVQIPWVSSSVENELRLTRTAALPTLSISSGDSPAQAGLSVDWVLWQFIKTSSIAEDFVNFLKVFSGSAHADEARQILASRSAGAGAESKRQVLIYSEDQLQSVKPSLLISSADEGVGEDVTGGLGQEFVYATTADRAPPERLRAWPVLLPKVREGLGSMVRDCDLLAADPDDPHRVAPGVGWRLVNIRSAIRACAYANGLEPDNPRFLFQFGRVLDISGRYDWARQFYQRAIDLGYPAAMTNLGYMYRIGRGVDQDYGRAFELYKRAALLGNPRARTNIGQLYERGWGVEQSPAEAILWYRLAGSHGWPNAIDALGNVYRKGIGVEQDPAAAVQLYQYAAQIGQTNAMVNLGRAYLAGEGIEQDRDAGLRWLQQSADLGNRYAPFHLAREIRDADPERAEDLLLTSAERGFVEARVELAELYAARRGSGDLTRAYYQATLAVRLGEEKAEEVRNEIGARLSAARRAEIDRQVEEWVRENGQ